LGYPIGLIGLVGFEEWSWLKIEKNVEFEFRIVSTHFVRLTSQELGVLKPFQQNAAHFVGFFASHLFTKASF
jgi:hypothetical protein